MNKNWIIICLAFMLVIEYKTGFKRTFIIEDPNFKLHYPTTTIRQGHLKTYIDIRNVKRIYKLPITEMRVR